MGTKNVFRGEPRHGAMGQKMTQTIGKGGYNAKAKPMGMTTGTRNYPCSPQCGSEGQRLAGRAGGGKATGYPPGYTSR